MACGVSNGHVIDDVTWHHVSQRWCTVGYPGDRLASCCIYDGWIFPDSLTVTFYFFTAKFISKPFDRWQRESRAQSGQVDYSLVCFNAKQAHTAHQHQQRRLGSCDRDAEGRGRSNEALAVNCFPFQRATACLPVRPSVTVTRVDQSTRIRKPCCRKETARCRSYSLWF